MVQSEQKGDASAEKPRKVTYNCSFGYTFYPNDEGKGTPGKFDLSPSRLYVGDGKYHEKSITVRATSAIMYYLSASPAGSQGFLDMSLTIRPAPGGGGSEQSLYGRTRLVCGKGYPESCPESLHLIVAIPKGRGAIVDPDSRQANPDIASVSVACDKEDAFSTSEKN